MNFHMKMQLYISHFAKFSSSILFAVLPSSSNMPVLLELFSFHFMNKTSSSRLKISVAWYCSADSLPCVFILNQDSAISSISIKHCPFPFWAQLWMINKTYSSLQTCNTSYFSSDLFCKFSIMQGRWGTSQQNAISTLTLLFFQCLRLLEHMALMNKYQEVRARM